MTDVKLYHDHEFDKRFYEHLQTVETLQEAWELTESDFKKVFGVNRYASYESYRCSKYYRMKKRKDFTA